MEWRNVKTWISILFFVILIIWFLEPIYDDYQISNNHRFTIGITTGWTRTGKGPIVNYRFSVYRKDFENNAPSGRATIELEGGRYFVKFLSSDPTISRIIWDMPVPSNITEAPIDGWNEILK